jgi:competence protein ComEA
VKLVACFALVCNAAFAQLPQGEGKALTEKVCTSCHGVEAFQGQRLDKAGWEKVIGEMVARGAEASDADFDKIVGYLARVLGKVNVNTALAEELETSLELSPEEAAAIVGYREKHGAFKTFDDLKKTPGVDSAKIDAKKDQIAF